MNMPLLMLLGWAVMAMVMAALWVRQKRTHNAGIVDVAWSFGTGLLAVVFAWQVEGDQGRKWIVAVLAGLWATRLGYHLVKRMAHEEEDGRYRMMRERYGSKAQSYLFGFFQIQAFWAVMFTLPMVAAAANDAPGLHWFDYGGIAIWLIAMIGESIADMQLARFRQDASTNGQVCNRGLWRYSRHPNYFFEWIHWFAYLFIAWNSSWWWVTWIGVLVMWFFLTKVTGIPLTEMRALQTRGDAYRQYQQTTSAFFPMPPRSKGAE